jgi:hypothetical protein
MKLQPFLIVFAAGAMVATTACRKEKDPVIIQPVNSTHILFDNLEVGQKSRYLEILGENYGNANDSSLVYTDDTLSLEIIGEDVLGFKVEERLHYVGGVDDWLNTSKDEVFVYYIQAVNDSLKIIPESGGLLQSRIFGYSYKSKGLPLADINSPLLKIKGWKTSLNYCECYQSGYFENTSILNQSYNHLNVIVNNSPMAVDGNGETFVFSAEYGIVRFTTYSWWTQSGFGWDLIP